MSNQSSSAELERVIADLAARVDCFTEEEMLLLFDITPARLKDHRYRRTGPAYIKAGNRFLYPRISTSEWLNARVSVPVASGAKGML